MALLRVIFETTNGTNKTRSFGNFDPETLNQDAVRKLAKLFADLHVWKDAEGNQYESVNSIALIETVRTPIEMEED